MFKGCVIRVLFTSNYLKFESRRQISQWSLKSVSKAVIFLFYAFLSCTCDLVDESSLKKKLDKVEAGYRSLKKSLKLTFLLLILSTRL